jgi:iron(III) transport system substrate-binding protein
VNRIEAGEDPLIERMKQEGDRSPADVLITVDAGRLWRAEQAGLLQPVKSAVLEERIPAALRHPDGLWYGFSLRARPIYYAKGKVDPAKLASYETSRPGFQGEDLHPRELQRLHLSLMSSMIAAVGPRRPSSGRRAWSPTWRAPRRVGDTDQLTALARANATSPSRTPITSCAC